MKKIQVSYLGLNSLFGRVTTNLLKQSPCIEKLSLYDDDDISQLEDGANVFLGREQLSQAVKNVDIVVIGDELSGTHGEKRLKIIGPKIIRYTEAILASSPNAIILVAASPLNILVPLVGHFLGPDWHHRLLGITSVDTLRASRILNGLLNNPLGESHILPVVGGSSSTSRVPLFSHIHPKTLICTDIREKILEKMKSFDNSKYGETDSVERAYSAVRFIHSIISGMLKDSPIPEIAMTKTTEIPNAEFFSLPMLIGKNGVEYAMPLPKFDESEEKMFLEATERLAEDSRKARNFINSLAQESVRNSNSDSDVCLQNNESELIETDGGLSTRGVQEATSFKRISAQRIFQKHDKGIHNVNKHCNKVDYENRDFKYRFWAKRTDNEKESQEFSRKTIPVCPDYQLIPGTKLIGRDFRKLVEDDKTTKSTNKSVGLAESKTTNKIAEDVSSNCGRVLPSQTQTVLETSNGIEAVREQDIPQPGAIRQLISEVKHSAASSNDSNPLRENTVERLPSPQDSDASADESVDSDSTPTLLEEVNHHLGDQGKYASTITQIEAHKSEPKLMRGEFTHPDNCENGGNRVVDNGTPERIYQNNSGIASDSCSMKHPKTTVLVRKSKSEVDATCSNSEKSHEESRKDLPSLSYNHEYLKRNRTVPTKNCDERIVNGNTENNLPTYDVQIDSVRTHHHSRNKSTFPSFENNNYCEQPKVQYSSLDKLKQAEDVQDPNQNSRHNKVVRKIKLGETIGVASNNHQKNLSKGTTEISLYGGKKPVSKRPGSNEERSNQYTKDRGSNKLPGVRHIPKMFPVRAVASEERILCLSDSRNEKILNDYPKVEMIRYSPTMLSEASTLPKSTIPPEEDFGKSEKFERPQSKATTPDSSSRRGFPTSTKTLKDVKWTTNGEDLVVSSFVAAKSRDADSCYMRELHASQSFPCQSETPLKLLNLPGGKQRYEMTHTNSEFEERPKDTPDVDLFTETTKTELTADKTKGYYMRQKRGSALNNQTYGRSQNLGSSKRKLSRKKSSENRETSTMKRKSTRVSTQLSNERKKLDCKTSDGKQSTAVVNPCPTITKLNQHRHSRNTLSTNTTNKEKCESGLVPAKSSSSAKENDWESKYFTKASEMFFRMFKDTVSNKKIAQERGGLKMNDVINESVDVKKNVQETKGRSLGVETQDLSRKENVKMNRSLNKKVPFEDNSVKDSTKQDGTVEKPVGNNVRSTESDIRKAKTPKVNTKNVRNLKMNKKSNGLKSVKNTEGQSVNKLSKLQSLDSKAETEISSEKKGAENSVFNTKITGMAKYQIEKNDNVRKEIKMNSPIDVEKLFEESSTIPLDSFHGSDKKLWMSTDVTEKGTKHGLANQQPFLQGVTATSDKGKGDAMNMIDFSISKNSGPLRNDVGQTGLNTFLETSSNGRTAQPTSAPKNGADWRAPVVHVPISSKTIKQVNPQNYKEQILNSNHTMRKMEGDVQSCEKTNKWDRILTIFKHIITSDLEDKSKNVAKSVEFGKCLNNPVQLREAPLKTSNAPLKLSPNQKIVKGKISSTVKKKTVIAKKKQPTETIRRNRVLKNNPKKIVNYFSKRGNAGSTKENPILTKLVVNSFVQNPEFFNGHTVNVTKNIKPEMSLPPKIK